MRLGTCELCGVAGVWVNALELPVGNANKTRAYQACAGCFDLRAEPRNPRTNKAAKADDAGPSWDDAVRAYEEDR